MCSDVRRIYMRLIFLQLYTLNIVTFAQLYALKIVTFTIDFPISRVYNYLIKQPKAP